MQKILVAVLLFFICAISGLALTEADLNTISFTNNLSKNKTIDYLFFAPADSDYWGPDVLSKDNRIPSGQKQEFQVFYPDNSASFDFMAVDNDGMTYEIKGVEIKDGKSKSVLISDKYKTDKTLESLNMTEVEISNDTNNDFNYLFLSPADSKIYGLDLFGSDASLPAGGKQSFLVLLAGEKFELDLLGLDAGDNSYEKTISVGTEEDSLYYSINEDDASTE